MISEVIQCFYGATNGRLPSPENAVAIEHEDLHFDEEVDVRLFESFAE